MSSNPNEHHRQDSVLPASKERNRYRSITWEEYDPVHQKYLEIGMFHLIQSNFLTCMSQSNQPRVCKIKI